MRPLPILQPNLIDWYNSFLSQFQQEVDPTSPSSADDSSQKPLSPSKTQKQVHQIATTSSAISLPLVDESPTVLAYDLNTSAFVPLNKNQKQISSLPFSHVFDVTSFRKLSPYTKYDLRSLPSEFLPMRFFLEWAFSNVSSFSASPTSAICVARLDLPDDIENLTYALTGKRILFLKNKVWETLFVYPSSIHKFVPSALATPAYFALVVPVYVTMPQK